MYTDEATFRADALVAAAMLLNGQPIDPVQLTRLADRLVPWIRSGPLTGRPSERTYTQGTSSFVPTVITPGGSVQLKDNQQFTVTLDPQDSKGIDTTDAGITWTEDSNGVTVTLQPADDGLSCLIVAGTPGTANYKASDGTREFDGSAIVTPGDVATLTGTEGQPEDQPTA